MTDSPSSIHAIANWLIETATNPDQYNLLSSCRSQFDFTTGIMSIDIPPENREEIIQLTGFIAQTYNAIEGCKWVELTCGGDRITLFAPAAMSYVAQAQHQSQQQDNTIQSKEQDSYP